MNRFQFRAWLRYRLRAKGRHGTHSPFIYKLVEECLLLSAPALRKYPDEERLLHRLQEYFAAQKPAVISGNPETWLSEATAAIASSGSAIIIVCNIHASSAETCAWQGLQQLPGISATADMLDVGLLIMDESFKERQHFVLRWR